jgi:hypothetical protein
MVVDLAAARRARRLRAWLDGVEVRLATASLPTPEELGWTVIARDEEGRALRVYCARYGAVAGYVDGQPDFVYVDFRQVCRAYATTLEELLVGLETGFLPDPVAELDSIGVEAH